MRYEGMVYRPPSEARSLIVQLTVGCSQNGCCFCDMYKDKRFYIRELDDVIDDFRSAREYYRHASRIFLADGDALICKTQYLIDVLSYIARTFPECERVSSYASPRSVLVKTPEELASIRSAGLELLYIGLESGCDDVLTYMNKQATASEIIRAGVMCREAGFQTSVTVISGLGGETLTQRHALDSASALSAMKPNYIGGMTLQILPGTVLHDRLHSGEFKPLSGEGVLRESMLMIEHLDAEGCVFRSNHISNYVNIKGTLNADRDDMVGAIRAALADGAYSVRHLRQL